MKRALFKGNQTILRAEGASPPQELSKFGAECQFFASMNEKAMCSWIPNWKNVNIDYIRSKKLSTILPLFLKTWSNMNNNTFLTLSLVVGAIGHRIE